MITINGTKKKIDAALDIASLLQAEGYADKLIAVALNGEFVPRAQYAAIKLKNGDAIDIVAPMQGG